ncbi:hypothetical protein [Bifidobacterium sp.]|uniref:hypothetical protein n=1 Tax=Bifidobacterium sp. TaxID=41200 RepID=UPI000EBBF54E|nr:hypothetical protein [Bifidobacterium sp.]HCF97347.1 hypothetical protein [Bifidobacterium sp.]
MMVTNLISNPRANVTLKPGEYTPISTIGKQIGVAYWCTVWLDVSGGSVTLDNCPDTFSKSQRIGWSLTSTNANPMSLRYRVVSGSPTVKVWNMVLCELGEYQANKALLDGLNFFDGDTMPRA